MYLCTLYIKTVQCTQYPLDVHGMLYNVYVLCSVCSTGFANVLCIYVHCTSKLYSIHRTYTVCCTMYMYCVVCAVLDFSSNNVGIFRSGRVLFLSDTVLKTAYTSGLVVYSFCLTLY